METKYRIKYWRWNNEHFGEWNVTDPMSFDAANSLIGYVKSIYEYALIVEDKKKLKGKVFGIFQYGK